MSATIPLFTEHSRVWQTNRYVYPVISRRSRGLSIGVNLTRDKVCNFDCVYCSVDRNAPAEAREPVDVVVLERELDQMLGLAKSGELFARPPFSETPPELRRVNDVAFSGDAEPTSAPLFPAACRLAAGLLAAHGLAEVKVVVITNATLLHRPEVSEALQALGAGRGEIWAKLDAGTEEQYRRLNRSRVPLARVLQNLAQAGRQQPLVIQSMFLRLQGQPPPESEIAAWLGRLDELRGGGADIARVQVYTVARRTAEADATPLERERLDAIARTAAERGFAVEVFYGPA